jgi:hypothetical protein
VWRPSTEQEIVAAAISGTLQETHVLDAKACLPDPRRNKDLAVDVAAMAIDGGRLVYGVAEDDHRQPTMLRPIELAGAPERVDQIVQTRVLEPPYIEIHTIPASQDPGCGYLVVIVPQSPRAPHQVDGRFYGRGATGNRVLDEGEIARLYQRRREWDVDFKALLAEDVEEWGFEPHGLGCLYALARPVAARDDLLEQATQGEPATAVLAGALASASAQDVLPPGVASPDLSSLGGAWERFGADSWSASTESEPPNALERLLTAVVDLAGTGHLFWRPGNLSAGGRRPRRAAAVRELHRVQPRPLRRPPGRALLAGGLRRTGRRRHEGHGPGRCDLGGPASRRGPLAAALPDRSLRGTAPAPGLAAAPGAAACRLRARGTAPRGERGYRLRVLPAEALTDPTLSRAVSRLSILGWSPGRSSAALPAVLAPDARFAQLSRG